MTRDPVPLWFNSDMAADEPDSVVLGGLIQDFAVSVNEYVRKSRRAISEEFLTQVDVMLGASAHPLTANIAKLPDDFAFTLVQTTGGLLHAAGTLLTGPTPSPVPLAVLTRSIAEHSATCVYVCRAENHLVRTVRAAILARQNLIEEGARKPSHPFHDGEKALDRLIQTQQRENSSAFKPPPSAFESLVSQELGEVFPLTHYKLLHRYVHPNPTTTVMTSLTADQRPAELRRDAYDLSFLSAMAFHAAASAVVPTRDGDPTPIGLAVDRLSQYKELSDSWSASIQGADRSRRS